MPPDHVGSMKGARLRSTRVETEFQEVLWTQMLEL